jgi:hypothetical protein
MHAMMTASQLIIIMHYPQLLITSNNRAGKAKHFPAGFFEPDVVIAKNFEAGDDDSSLMNTNGGRRT